MHNWSLSTFPSEEEVTYKLETYKSNYMLIFSSYNHFSRIIELDVKYLKLVFREFEFEIQEHKDLKKAEIMDKLNILRDKDFTEYGCVAVVVLTHGGDGGTLMANDGPYNEKEIIEYFKSKTNPTLITKPKILIVQALRRRIVSSSSDCVEQPDLSYTLNLEPDILILHGSYPGGYPERKQHLRSWLIQLLCDNIARHSPKLDLESIVTEVKRNFYCYKITQGKHDFEEKITTISISTLTRRLFFRKYKDYIEYNEKSFFKKMHEYFKFDNEEDCKFLLYG